MPPRLLALEYVVEDLDVVLELLVDLLGLEVVARGPHPALDAEMVTLDLGSVALTVLHPTNDGDRAPLHPTACNLSQLVLDAGEPLEPLVARLAERGVGVVVDSVSMAHVSAQTTAAVFGVAPALVLTDLPDQPDEGPAGDG